MTTSHVAMTDADRDLLRTVADCIDRGVPVNPWLAAPAIRSLRELAGQHDRYTDVTRRIAEAIR